MDERRGFIDILLELSAMFRAIEPSLFNVIHNLKLIRDGEENEGLLDINGCIYELNRVMENVHKWDKLQIDSLVFFQGKINEIKEILERPAPGRKILR